jgi:hypothetical protein
MPTDASGKFHMSGLRPGKDGKLPKMKEMASPPAGKKEQSSEPMPETSVTEIHHNPDGTHTTKHGDGSEEQHPDHLHMLAHLGHHVTGGDKHHVVHHDGMGMHSHGIHESGEHDGTHDHENLDELKSSMDQFLGEEGQEGQGEMEPENESHALGGM